MWTQDNNKEMLLWEMGNQGGVGGDIFVKVAYEEPHMQPPLTPSADGTPAVPIPGIQYRMHPGRVRVLVVNQAFCLSEDTEILTRRGWLSHSELRVGDEALSLDPDTDKIVWSDVEAVNEFAWDGPLYRWESERFSALSTSDHRWILEADPRVKVDPQRRIRTTDQLHESKASHHRLVVGGGTPMAFSEVEKWSSDLVELVGWFITEGSIKPYDAVGITQSETVNPENVGRIRRLVSGLTGYTAEYAYEGRNSHEWYLSREAAAALLEAAPSKALTPEFICSLTYAQARLLYETLLAGDGHTRRKGSTTTWAQDNWGRTDGFQMLASMLGIRTQARFRWRQDMEEKRGYAHLTGETTAYSNRHHNLQNLKRTTEHYRGVVWCPTTSTGTWLARRKEVVGNGSGSAVCYWTGNCFP